MSSTTTDLLTRLVRALAFLALAGALLWPLELLWPRVRPRFTPRAWAGDVGWLLLGALTLSFVVGPVLRDFAVPAAPSALRLIAAFLGAELMAYASHRAMHELPSLWRFHAVHHAPKELDWLKAWRQHPVDVAIHALCVGLPGALLGAPLSSLAALVLLRRLWTGLLHANVRLPLGALEGLVVTPDFHHAHHVDGRVNFAGLLPCLDVLFGTARPKASPADGAIAAITTTASPEPPAGKPTGDLGLSPSTARLHSPS